MAHPNEKVGNEIVVNDQVFGTDDNQLTGRDVLRLASYAPASDFSVVVIEDLGTTSLGLDEDVKITPDRPTHFRVFKGDRLFRGLLNEREFVWGDPKISNSDLRLIGNIDDDEDLFLDSSRDRPIADDDYVNLKRSGVERIRSAEPSTRVFNIILNGQRVEIEAGRISFSELSKLAFPELFGRDLICFTVSFSRGPRRKPEGTLLEGGKVRLVEGMVFNVSSTDKS